MLTARRAVSSHSLFPPSLSGEFVQFALLSASSEADGRDMP